MESQGGDGEDPHTVCSLVNMGPATGGGECDEAAVTHLLTQPLGSQTQIAALRRDGSITVWQEDGTELVSVRSTV